MNWEIVASTGEWAGAIAVVASLIYLARQIQLSNQQTRAAARYSFLDAYGRANAALSETLQSASVYRRGLDDSDLTHDESMQFLLQLGQFLNTWSVMYDLFQEDELPDNQWHLVKSDIVSAFSTPGGRRFWDEVGRINGHATFAEFVDKLLAEGGDRYQISPTGG